MLKKGRFARFNKSGNLISGRYYYRNCKNNGVCKDKTQILESGYTLAQTWKGLSKAWLGYVISSSKQEKANRKYYASVVQKLQQELVDAGVVSAVNMADFPDLGLYAYNERNKFKEQLEEDFEDQKLYLPPEQLEFFKGMGHPS